MTDREIVEIDGETGEVSYPPRDPRKRYRCPLDTLQDVRREMAKVYREARTGVTKTQEATKLTWMLERIGKSIEGSDLEQRVAALEGKGNGDQA